MKKPNTTVMTNPNSRVVVNTNRSRRKQLTWKMTLGISLASIGILAIGGFTVLGLATSTKSVIQTNIVPNIVPPTDNVPNVVQPANNAPETAPPADNSSSAVPPPSDNSPSIVPPANNAPKVDSETDAQEKNERDAISSFSVSPMKANDGSSSVSASTVNVDNHKTYITLPTLPDGFAWKQMSFNISGLDGLVVAATAQSATFSNVNRSFLMTYSGFLPLTQSWQQLILNNYTIDGSLVAKNEGRLILASNVNAENFQKYIELPNLPLGFSWNQPTNFSGSGAETLSVSVLAKSDSYANVGRNFVLNYSGFMSTLVTAQSEIISNFNLPSIAFSAKQEAFNVVAKSLNVTNYNNYLELPKLPTNFMWISPTFTPQGTNSVIVTVTAQSKLYFQVTREYKIVYNGFAKANLNLQRNWQELARAASKTQPITDKARVLSASSVNVSNYKEYLVLPLESAFGFAPISIFPRDQERTLVATFNVFDIQDVNDSKQVTFTFGSFNLPTQVQHYEAMQENLNHQSFSVSWIKRLIYPSDEIKRLGLNESNIVSYFSGKFYPSWWKAWQSISSYDVAIYAGAFKHDGRWALRSDEQIWNENDSRAYGWKGPASLNGKIDQWHGYIYFSLMSSNYVINHPAPNNLILVGSLPFKAKINDIAWTNATNFKITSSDEDGFIRINFDYRTNGVLTPMQFDLTGYRRR